MAELVDASDSKCTSICDKSVYLLHYTNITSTTQRLHTLAMLFCSGWQKRLD